MNEPDQMTTGLPESSSTKYRSFQPTPPGLSVASGVGGSPFRKALNYSIVQQLPMLFLSALLLDGGLVFKQVLVASIAYWVMALMLMICNRNNSALPATDQLLLKWGYLPILLGTCTLWIIGTSSL